VLDSDASGAPRTIFAAYTDHFAAVIRVLRAGTAGFEVAAEPAQFDLYGSECEVTIRDLNADGQPDVHLTFLGSGNSVDWLFSWDGQDLRNLAPTRATERGTLLSELRNAELLDLNGDGIPEVSSSINVPEGGSPTPTRLYRWSAGQYESDQQVVGPWVFTRAAGSPATDRILVLLPPTAQGPFTMHVVNGTAMVGTRVENAVESARIWMNGQEIFRPNDFGNNVATIERTVVLQSMNELQVRLAGAPSGRITVLIKASAWPMP
jgi:hypothetical protein